MLSHRSWRDLPPELREAARKEFESVERSAEQKRKDLVKAFDDIHELKCRLRGLKTRIWVLSGALTGLAGVTGWLANHLYACVTQGGIAGLVR